MATNKYLPCNAPASVGLAQAHPNYRYSMRIYRYSTGFRTPAVDQSY